MSDLSGSQFGNRFRVIRQLGVGGFASVLEAVDEELGREVAIKKLRSAAYSDAELRKRFLREAKVLANISNRAIVSIYSFGIGEDNLPYLVMEFVRGKSLRQYLNERKNLSEQESLLIARSIAEALAVVHDQGILHRDLKPDNVIVETVADDKVDIKLIDFGFAGVLPDAAVKDDKLTQTGLIFGSVFYMSPEACKGRSVDLRADLYSLGCIFYECFTGSPPFAGETAIGIVHQHMESMPAEPVSPAGTLSPAGRQLLLRLMQKEASGRPSSASEVVLQVDRSLADNAIPGESSNSAPMLEFRKPATALRYRSFLGIAACSLLVMSVGVYLSWSTSQKERYVSESKHLALSDQRKLELRVRASKLAYLQDYERALNVLEPVLYNHAHTRLIGLGEAGEAAADFLAATQWCERLGHHQAREAFAAKAWQFALASRPKGLPLRRDFDKVFCQSYSQAFTTAVSPFTKMRITAEAIESLASSLLLRRFA